MAEVDAAAATDNERCEQLYARMCALRNSVRHSSGSLSAASSQAAQEIFDGLTLLFGEAEYLDLSTRDCQEVVKFCDRLGIEGPGYTSTMALMHMHYERGEGDEDDYLCY